MLLVRFIFVLCSVVKILHCDENENSQHLNNGVLSQNKKENPCEIQRSVVINISQTYPNNSVLSQDGVLYFSDEYFEHHTRNKSEIRGCICLKKPCLKRCCPDGNVFNINGTCQEYDEKVFSPPYREYIHGNVSNHFHFIDERLNCPINEQSFEAEGIEKDGSIYDLSTQIGSSKYCSANFLYENTLTYEYYKCSDDEESYIFGYSHHIYATGLFLSFIFLLATYLVYIFFPELRKQHGKYVMNFVLSLLLACLSMFIIKVVTITYKHDEIATGVCHSMVLLTYFFTMSSFLWMNVMCIDIYLTFSKPMAVSSNNHLFFYHFAYAWGFSLFLLILTIILQYCPNIPPHVIVPRIGDYSCWFEEQASRYFVYIPMSILLAINVLLFSLTTYNIIKTKRETALLNKGANAVNKHNRANTQRFSLYFRLFLVMGINWIAEVISHFFKGNDYHWIVTDTLNTLIGVFIFFLFIWKKHVRAMIMRRFRGREYNSRNDYEVSSYRSRTTFNSSTRSQSLKEGLPMTSIAPID